jgi:acyl carrier protein
MSTHERLAKVIKKAIDREESTIGPDDDFFEGKLSLDSIDMLEIVLGIKKEFGVQLSLDKGQTPNFRNIRELGVLIDEALIDQKFTTEAVAS